MYTKVGSGELGAESTDIQTVLGGQPVLHLGRAQEATIDSGNPAYYIAVKNRKTEINSNSINNIARTRHT